MLDPHIRSNFSQVLTTNPHPPPSRYIRQTGNVLKKGRCLFQIHNLYDRQKHKKKLLQQQERQRHDKDKSSTEYNTVFIINKTHRSKTSQSITET